MTFKIHRFITANTIDTAVEYVWRKLFTTKIKDATPHTGLVTHMPTEATKPIRELDISVCEAWPIRPSHLTGQSVLPHPLGRYKFPIPLRAGGLVSLNGWLHINSVHLRTVTRLSTKQAQHTVTVLTCTTPLLLGQTATRSRSYPKRLDKNDKTVSMSTTFTNSSSVSSRDLVVVSVRYDESRLQVSSNKDNIQFISASTTLTRCHCPYTEQVHKAASPPHMHSSVVFARWRQCVPIYRKPKKWLPWQRPAEPWNRLCLHWIAWPKKPPLESNCMSLAIIQPKL